jgi:hypothetical protein
MPKNDNNTAGVDFKKLANIIYSSRIVFLNLNIKYNILK